MTNAASQWAALSARHARILSWHASPQRQSQQCFCGCVANIKDQNTTHRIKTMGERMIEIWLLFSKREVCLETVANKSMKLRENELLSLLLNNCEMLQELAHSPAAQSIGEISFDSINLSSRSVSDLLARFPKLTSLRLVSGLFELASDILEHPKVKIHTLDVHCHQEKGYARFFAALQQSQVTKLSLRCGDLELPFSKAFWSAFSNYLSQDRLTSLTISCRTPWNAFPSSLVHQCIRLKKMELVGYAKFANFHLLPHSLTDLRLFECILPQGSANSNLCEFLVNSNVSCLHLYWIMELNGLELAKALIQCAGRIKSLMWHLCGFSDIAALWLLQIVKVRGNVLDDLQIDALDGAWFIDVLAASLLHENCRLRTLKLWLRWPGIRDNPNALIRAFNGKPCSLRSLQLCTTWPLSTNEGMKQLRTAQRELDLMFTPRSVLLALLSGQQSEHCSLRRLPVEMFRLVKGML